MSAFSPFDPRGFCKLADELLKDGKYTSSLQTRIRTSIGRAYYAAFLLSKRKQEANGHSFSDPQRIHQDVIDSLHDDSLSQIASKLDELRGFRVEADYDMDRTFVSTEGDKCVKLATNIMGMLGGT